MYQKIGVSSKMTNSSNIIGLTLNRALESDYLTSDFARVVVIKSSCRMSTGTSAISIFKLTPTCGIFSDLLKFLNTVLYFKRECYVN